MLRQSKHKLSSASVSEKSGSLADRGTKGQFFRMIWRWHFYAGLFCIPFVMVLATTGAIFLFKPQIDSWIDRPYDHLKLTGAPASAESQVEAALAVVPGSVLQAYELPKAPDAAAQIIVKRGGEE